MSQPQARQAITKIGAKISPAEFSALPSTPANRPGCLRKMDQSWLTTLSQSLQMDAPTSLASIDSALRLLDREVWVITAAEGQRRGGLVAIWVAPASIDRERPALLVGLGANHFTI